MPHDGERWWISADNKTRLFLESQSHRINKQDPAGKTRQIQSPMEVGCAVELQVQMTSQGKGSGLNLATKPWGFMLSCLKYMGMDTDIICLPVLKIWKKEQLLKGEVLITMLCSSLVEDGGYNTEQAGTNSGDVWNGKKAEFEDEI